MSERPLHVVVLGAWMRFPHGMAATSRIRLLARALQQAGADVRVICLQAVERPPHVENTQAEGVYEGVPFEYATGTTVRHNSFLKRRLIAAWGWTHGALRLVQLRRQGGLDVVYLWSWGPPPSGHKLFFLTLLWMLGVPVVTELNEEPWSLREDATAIAQRMPPLIGVSAVVSISDSLTAWVKREARRRARRIKVIEVPIVVDVDEQSPAEYPTGEPLVVFAGAPVYDQTILFILKAMERVWRDIPQCRLVVTGANSSDPAAKWLFAEAFRLRADSRVTFPGYVSRSELFELYSRAHALLIPLFDDGRSKARFPTKIGEYLAAARPIVTTAVGEIPRYFEDGVNASVCAPGDSELYGAQIVALLRAPDLAAAVGQRGRVTAAEHFHYELHSETLAKGFSEVAGRAFPRGVAT